MRKLKRRVLFATFGEGSNSPSGCFYVPTGQNYDYELNQVFFEDLELRKPDYFLEAAGKTACKTVGLVIVRVDEVLAKEQPEAVLILGDTNSCSSISPLPS